MLWAHWDVWFNFEGAAAYATGRIFFIDWMSAAFLASLVSVHFQGPLIGSFGWGFINLNHSRMEKKLGELKVATTTNYLMEPKLESGMQEATIQSLKPTSADSQACKQK